MKGKLILLAVAATLAVRAFSQEQPITVESRIGKLQFTHDFANGYPTKQTVEKLYDERDSHRGCQWYLWSLPTVSFAECQAGQALIGAKNGDIANNGESIP